MNKAYFRAITFTTLSIATLLGGEVYGMDTPTDNDPVIPYGRVIQVDFGRTDEGFKTPGWNNMDSFQQDSKLFLHDDTGVDRNITLTITKAFKGINTAGLKTNTLGFPSSMTRDSFWVGDPSGNEKATKNGGQLQISGLDVNADYKITLFATREGDDSGRKRLTDYTFDTGISTRTIDASDNIDKQLVLRGLNPDSSGIVTIDVGVKKRKNEYEEGSRFGYLGGMLIETDEKRKAAEVTRDILTTNNTDLLSHIGTEYVSDEKKEGDPLALPCTPPPPEGGAVKYVGTHEDIQDAIDQNGTKVIVLKKGKHRIKNALKPKDKMKIYGSVEGVGENCKLVTRLMGSVELNPEKVEGQDYYFAEIPEDYHPPISRSWAYQFKDKCAQDEDEKVINPRCYFPDDLLIVNNVTGELITYLRHIDSGEAGLVSGTWFIAPDPAEKDPKKYKHVYMHFDGYDPATMDVEFARSHEAFLYSAQNGATHGWYKPNPWNSSLTENREVGIYNLIVENFATPLQYAAIGGQGAPAGWHIEGNIVRNNHGAGISVGAESVVRYNHVYDNGQLGLIGHNAMHSIVDANTIYRNNRAFVSTGFSAGGAKITKSYGLRYTRNCAYRNRGPGLWTDVSTQEVIYQWNVVAENTGSGIFHEISYDAEILDNLVGFNASAKGSGGQIYVSTSDFVEVKRNQVIEPGDVEGAAINVTWSSRGIGERYNPDHLVDKTVIDDKNNHLYPLVPGITDMWVGRDNTVENNQVYHQGTRLVNDILLELHARSDRISSEQHQAFEKSIESNTIIESNRYYSEFLAIPPATSEPKKVAYLWRINGRETDPDMPNFNRLSLAEVKAITENSQSLGFEKGSELNKDFSTGDGIRLTLGDPNDPPIYCAEITTLVNQSTQ